MNVWSGSSVGSGLDSYVAHPGFESRRKHHIGTNATRLPPSLYILENQRHIDLISCLCSMGCKRSLVLEVEERVSVYLINIIIIRLCIAINELQSDVNQ